MTGNQGVARSSFQDPSHSMVRREAQNAAPEKSGHKQQTHLALPDDTPCQPGPGNVKGSSGYLSDLFLTSAIKAPSLQASRAGQQLLATLIKAALT